MNKNLFVAALVIGLLGATGLSAKGITSASRGTVNQTQIMGNPLTINVGDDHAFQVYSDLAPGAGQFYPSVADLADMGWFVRAGGTLTAPAFSDHAGGTATAGLGTYTPFSARSVSAVTGAGTAASPYSVTVTGTTAGGLIATQVVTYVNGENFFRQLFTLRNTGGASVSARVFLGSDLFLASSDSGVPFREPMSGAPGGQTCAGVTPVYTILHISTGIQAPSAFSADSFSSIWSQINSGALNNTVNPGSCIDNGAALQWDLTVPAGGSATIQAATSFGDIPAVIQQPAVIAPAPALGLTGLASLALALLALSGLALRRK
ncbi:MAG: hypothetical protein H7A19_07305 [Rhodanobacteraceae bacterium]|nr:hypothetical protein [Rhodanobacteraceae bacterium]